MTLELTGVQANSMENISAPRHTRQRNHIHRRPFHWMKMLSPGFLSASITSMAVSPSMTT